MSIQRDFEFLYEMGCIRNIARTWKQMLGTNFANVAEHTFRLTWIALVLAKMEGGDLDTGKIAKMALIHDITESRTGDVHYVSRLYTTRNERLAIEDMLKGTSVQDEMMEIWEEYEKRESKEARIVKDADTLDVDLELHEQAANGIALEKELHPMREDNVLPRFYTESGKKLFTEIMETNVHDWHTNGRNRHNSGDWSQPVV